MPLGRFLALAFTGAGLVPLLVLAGVATLLLEGRLLDSHQERNALLAASAARQAAQSLAQPRLVMELAARQLETLAPGAASGSRALLENLLQVYPQLKLVEILDAQDRVTDLVPFDPRGLGVNQGTNPVVREARRTGLVRLGTATRVLPDPQHSLIIAQPLGERLLVGSLNLTGLQELMASLSRPPDFLVTLADETGTLLGHPDEKLVRERQKDIGLNQALSRYSGTQPLKFRPGDWLASTAFLERPDWTVTVYQKQSLALADLNSLLQALVAALSFGTVLALFLWVGFNRSVMNPLRALEQQAEGLARGEWNKRIAEKGFAEFRVLASQFNLLGAALTERENRLDLRRREMEGLLSAAGHDLRAPLVNIQAYTHRLEEGLKRLQETWSEDERKRYEDSRLDRALVHIQAGSRKLDSLLNGLIQVIRTGRQSVRPEWLDTALLIRGVLEALAIQCEQAGAEIRWEPLPALWADRSLASQALANLIQNALKYRDPQRPLVLTFGGQAQGPWIKVWVRDTGLGIAEDHQERVWDLFHRLDPGGPVEGEGIGLTVVKRLMDLHQGRVGLRSSAGQGSVFTLEFPAPPEGLA